MNNVPCLECDGLGHVEGPDVYNAGFAPVASRPTCKVCDGTGGIDLDDTAYEYVKALKDRHASDRNMLVAVRAANKNLWHQIDALRALLDAERDRCAEMARFVQEGVRS